MRQICVLVAMSGLAAICTAQHPFPDIPENHAYYERMEELYDAKLFLRTGIKPRMSGWPISHEEVAATTIRSVDALPKSIAAERVRLSHLLKGAYGRIGELQEAARLYDLKWRRSFEGLIEKFQDDIRNQGRDPKQLLRTLQACESDANALAAECRMQLVESGKWTVFKDVPFDHWAADAIRGLLEEGVLVGYPNGRFEFRDDTK